MPADAQGKARKDRQKTAYNGYPWRRKKQFRAIKGGQRGTFTLFEGVNCFTEEFKSCVTYVKKLNIELEDKYAVWLREG